MAFEWVLPGSDPREARQVTIAEHDEQGRVIGTRDAHVWHCSLSRHPEEPELCGGGMTARWTRCTTP
jgi:hypothetical protein